MYYGPLPRGMTQVMNLKGGEVIEFQDELWLVTEVGYGAGVMTLQLSQPAEVQVIEVSPDLKVRLVTSAPATEGLT